MTLDLIGILCSITVLNPSVREGALAFLFARTNTSYLPAKVTSFPKWDGRYSSFVFCQAFTNAGLHIPYVPLSFARHSFSSHTKHSRFFHGRLTPTTELLCEPWELTTWWALQVPLLRERNVEKAKRDLEFEKNNPGSKGSGEMYTQQRVITKTVFIQQQNRWYKPTAARKSWTWLHSAESFPGPLLALTHPLSFSTQTKVNDGILFKDYCSWHRHRHVRPVRKREAKLFKLMNCIHWF